MSSPFVAEIKMFAGNFAPTGYATCDGQILPISQNTALFSLLGTQYGGNGQSNFALPNFDGVTPIHQGQGAGLTNRVVGETGGNQNETLLVSELPAHSHALRVVDIGPRANNPAGTLLSQSTNMVYGPPANPVAMTGNATNPAGGSQPHNNMQPYLCITFIIALEGIFPPRG